MPRRIKPIKHTPFQFPQNEKGKKRYPNKAAAEKAAELRMLENQRLTLAVYQAVDGGWYLTSADNRR
jgi:hypothetical protein